MTQTRFLHSSDLHLGRRFANIPQGEDGHIRGRLMEARHTVISRLADAATARGITDILLAGDTFDTATPSAGVLRQTLAAMGEAEPITWWLLPGNHDALRLAEPLWEAIVRDAPANVRPLTKAEPVPLGPQATLLPCPVEWRAGGRDPSAPLLAMHSADGQARIGLAHGGVTDFTGSGDSIPPDRDRSARLDFLALGDWHGRLTVSDRVHYCGTPEPDRFKHGAPGVCLAVTLDGPGAQPQIEEVQVGQFLWQELALPLTPDQDAATAFRACLPSQGRRDTLMRIRAEGWAGLAAQAALSAAAAQEAPEFAHFNLRLDSLRTRPDRAELDAIDHGGAVRQAAEALQAEAEAAVSEQDQRIAADALARLFAYVTEEPS